MNSILNGMQRIRMMSLFYDGLSRVGNKLLQTLQKGPDQRKRSAAEVFILQWATK